MIKRSGIVIVLTLLVIAAVLAAAGIFTTLLLRELKITRLIDQSIQAHYIAESGAERALFQVRKRQAVPADQCRVIADSTYVPGGPELSACDELTGYCDGTLAGSGISCITETKANVAFLRSWAVQSSHEKIFNFFLNKGETIQIDLFNPYLESQSDGSLPTEIAAIRVDWGNSSYSDASLYYTLSELNTTAGNQELENDIISKATCSSACLAGSCLYCHTINPTIQFRSYLLRLRALDFLNTTPGPMALAAYDSNDPPNLLEIPSRLSITSIGEFGDTLQRVTVRTPTRPPLAGLYDFVLFSEERVVK